LAGWLVAAIEWRRTFALISSRLCGAIATNLPRRRPPPIPPSIGSNIEGRVATFIFIDIWLKLSVSCLPKDLMEKVGKDVQMKMSTLIKRESAQRVWRLLTTSLFHCQHEESKRKSWRDLKIGGRFSSSSKKHQASSTYRYMIWMGAAAVAAALCIVNVFVLPQFL
jgi:hypothetical protein